ncbi:hypothetical protein AL345_13770 [Aeromonas caviae]|nr:hypothetical protein AL345_13770 [Aeromonas caviae]
MAVRAERHRIVDGIRASVSQGAQVMHLEKRFSGCRGKGGLCITTLTFRGCGHQHPGFDLGIPHITCCGQVARGWLFYTWGMRRDGFLLVLDDLMFEFCLSAKRLSV